MQPKIVNNLEACPEDCTKHDVWIINDTGIQNWGQELAKYEVVFNCRHQEVCKLRKEVEDGEEHHAG